MKLTIQYLIALFVVFSLIACDKSSFQLRDGSGDPVSSDTTHEVPCEENCDTESEPDYEVDPDSPVSEPEHPTNDPYACFYEKELFGSTAYIVHGENSMELLWNYFEPRSNLDHQVAYYQVIVMDYAMNVFTSQPQELKDTSYLVRPQGIGTDDLPLSTKFSFNTKDQYWFKLIALDKNYEQVLIREFDYVHYANTGYFNRVVGFCSGQY